MIKGSKQSIEARNKISISRLGIPAWNKGKKINHTHHLLGTKHSDETRKKMSEKAKNRFSVIQNHPRYKTDRSSLAKRQQRNDSAYFAWRRDVWSRDKFKCKISDGNCSGRIEAHHILSWKDYPELRYEVNNGITLCHHHHPKKRVDEQKLLPYFKELLTKTH